MKKRFTSGELRRIKQNKKLIKKIYLLAGINITNAILGGNVYEQFTDI